MEITIDTDESKIVVHLKPYGYSSATLISKMSGTVETATVPVFIEALKNIAKERKEENVKPD